MTRRRSETIRLIEEVGGRGELLKFDVADTDASVKAITGWQESHPDNYVEVLVNNAGVRKDNLLLWLEPEDWFKVVSTDLNSFYNVTRPFLPADGLAPQRPYHQHGLSVRSQRTAGPD